jgi:hypothetical protein
MKKGDKIKVIDFNFQNSDLWTDEDKSQVYEIIHRSTDWRGRQFVQVRIAEREGLDRWRARFTIPAKNVIKVNTKLYDLKNKLLEESDE